MPIATASQTIGPYWHLIEDTSWADLTRSGAAGERLRLSGTVTDGDGAPFSDVCIELWQADPPATDRFPAFGRARTDAAGVYRFTTVKPGPVAGRGNTIQAPHLALWVLGRGLMRGLATRVYFAGDPRNETDPVLSSVEAPARRATLIAAPAGPDGWRFDIRLQGAGETVFFDV